MIGYYEKCMRCTNKYPKRYLIRKIIGYSKLKLFSFSFYNQNK